jgi:hypothetical protein
MAESPELEKQRIADMPVDDVPTRNKFGNVKTSALWGTIACGAGLFSDGYLNAVSIALFEIVTC